MMSKDTVIWIERPAYNPEKGEPLIDKFQMTVRDFVAQNCLPQHHRLAFENLRPGQSIEVAMPYGGYKLTRDDGENPHLKEYRESRNNENRI